MTSSKKALSLPYFENNLIQNFYVIGFSPEDFFKLDEKEKKGTFMDIFDITSEKKPILIPKILTKFPDMKKNFNSIPDNIIIDHCFPNGKIEFNNTDKTEFFQFHFEIKPQKYDDENKQIYSTIYFSCLEIQEPLLDYYKYKKEIVNLVLRNNLAELQEKDKTLPLNSEIENKYSNIYIPKILCFASVLPFYNELRLLLEYIYTYFTSKQTFSFLPLEKVIEKIVCYTPIPIKHNEEIIINFDTGYFDQKLVFPQFNLNDININYSANISLVKFFEIFTIDDVIRLFRYIIYEIPILFFSDSKNILSLFVNVFLTVLSPFKYAFPHTAILPKKLYGLISSEKKYIFGINEIYTEDFFENNKIELNKTLIIVSVFNTKKNNQGKTEEKIEGKIEEKIYDSNNTDNIYLTTNKITRTVYENINIYGTFTPVINVDIPNTFKKKLCEQINKYISFMKKKFIFSKKETAPKDFTLKIQTVFYKFFVAIMQGYTDSFVKSKYLYNDSFTKNINIGENTYIRNNDNFKREVFNEDDFLTKTNKDNIAFYRIFFNTDMFINFLRERIYSKAIIDQLRFKQFDQLTYLKKHSNMRKKKENKTLYEDFQKDYIDKVKSDSKKEIIINEQETFDNKDLEFFLTNQEKNTQLLLNFAQLIKVKDNIKDVENDDHKNMAKLIDINYLLFPKLNFEYLYRNNYENFNFLINTYLFELKNFCRIKFEEIIKLRPYAFYMSFFPKIRTTNMSCLNYEIKSKSYIYYIWFLVLSSTLWYCEKKEKNIRLDKMFNLFNNFEIIEEYVLNFVFFNIYKSADVFYLVKLFLYYYKTIGPFNYYLLNLFCDKIQSNTDSGNEESENIINDNNIEIKKDVVFSKRYLINPNYKFNEKIEEIRDDNNNNNGNNNVDELIFSSEQICQKCKEINNIDAKAIAESEIDLSVECHQYQCQKCQEKNDIIIKYQILNYNYSTKEIFLVETGHFRFLTPYKLYKDLKAYFIKENKTQLDIDMIFSFGFQINYLTIIFYFSLLNLSFDFLFPYEERLKTNIKIFVENWKIENNDINENNYKKKLDKPLKLNFSHNQINFRRFNNIQPFFTPKKVGSKLLGIIKLKDKYVNSDLSFTIKNTKSKNTKKK